MNGKVNDAVWFNAYHSRRGAEICAVNQGIKSCLWVHGLNDEIIGRRFLMKIVSL